MLRPNVPIQIILAWHALRAPFHRANILALRTSVQVSLVLPRLVMSFKIFGKVFAFTEWRLADFADVRFVCL